MTGETNPTAVRDVVAEKYGAAARRVLEASAKASCGPVSSCCGGAAFDGSVDPITSNLYVRGVQNVDERGDEMRLLVEEIEP